VAHRAAAAAVRSIALSPGPASFIAPRHPSNASPTQRRSRRRPGVAIDRTSQRVCAERDRHDAAVDIDALHQLDRHVRDPARPAGKVERDAVEEERICSS
jgi:hypothetical protein